MEKIKIVEATDEEIEQANRESIRQILESNSENQIRAKELISKLLSIANEYGDLILDMPFDKDGKVIPLNKWAKSLNYILKGVTEGKSKIDKN